MKMPGQFCLIQLVAWTFSSSLTLFAQTSSQSPNAAVTQAVQGAFPKALTYARTPSGEGTPVQPYHSCAAVFSQQSDGTPDLVAAGYSGRGAEIAMLSYSAGTASILDAVSRKQLWLPGGDCDASVTNMSDPTNPASPLAKVIEISFGGADWFFVWSGSKLVNITAPSYEFGPNRLPTTAMYETGIVDLDHSGFLQVVGTNGDFERIPRADGIASIGTWTLFRFNGTVFAPAKRLKFFDKYQGTGQRTIDVKFHQVPTSTFQLTIVNGARDGSLRLTGMTVNINGVTVISPSDLNQNVETVARTITLAQQNEVKVTFQGSDISYAYAFVQ
jgi:hypothetical protein